MHGCDRRAASRIQWHVLPSFALRVRDASPWSHQAANPSFHGQGIVRVLNLPQQGCGSACKEKAAEPPPDLAQRLDSEAAWLARVVLHYLALFSLHVMRQDVQKNSSSALRVKQV